VKRGLLAAVIAALMLPVLALAALVGEQERLRLKAEVVTVPLVGVDPRDLLRGRYLMAQFDWNWDSDPGPLEATALPGGLCVLPGDAARPRVRFVDRWTAGERIPDGCRTVIAGYGLRRTTGSRALFIPDGLDAGSGRLQIFVSEKAAAALEALVRDQPGALTVDLAVRADGHAVIKTVRANEQIVGR